MRSIADVVAIKKGEDMKSKSTETKPSIVFCHGLWADGSCFSKLIVPLQAEGYECIAAQYGLNSTAEDVALTKAAIGRVSSPVMLVGHSYGGSVITGAGTDDRVVGLVYICALAPDADETSQTQQSKFPRTDVFYRSRGWTYLAASGGHEVFLRRPFGAGAEARLGDPGRPQTRLVRGESRGNSLEIEAELVHRRQKRPHRASRSGAFFRQAHGRHNV